ncbi:MAG: hypothetical protein IPN76_16610 [Saprospiraceae bacterium]|nr:hypothetical protein [Saprospiraceae bacterium]
MSPQSPDIPPILLRLSWSHHIDLLSGCTSNEERLFCLLRAIKDRYDVRDLRRQIKSALFERQMLAKQTLLRTARWHDLHDQKLRNIITSEDFDIGRSRVTDDLLNLLRDLRNA